MTSRNDKIVKNLYTTHGDKMSSTMIDVISDNITPNTQQNAKDILQNLETQLKNAFAEDEKELERPMTYSEMRERYG
jgi:hypothetical protein